MRRATLAAVLVFTAAACNGSVAQTRTSAAAISSRTGTTAALCTFPVASLDEQSNWRGYFLTVPTAAKTAPVLIFVQPGQLFQTVDKPVLTGNAGIGGVYDRAFDRWLPAEWSAVSPDGTHYAYVVGRASDNELHIVDVRTGNDRIAIAHGKYYPLAYRSEGLYLAERTAGGLWTGSGLHVLDLTTNGIRRLHSSDRTEFWRYMAGNFAYGGDINPADPNPPGFGEAPDELVRFDLSSGAVVRFQYHPGQQAYPIGTTTSGQLIAMVEGFTGPQLIDVAGNAASIPGAPPDSWPFTDSQRTWLVSRGLNGTGQHRNSSLYLISDGRAVHEMDFQFGGNDRLAGTCA